jgi:hypothetical protein
MTVDKGLGRLGARERRLLGILLACFTLMVVVFIPFAVESLLGESREQNEQLTQVTSELVANQAAVAKSDAQRKAVAGRYAKTAPPLGAFVDGLARSLEVDVTENQDQPVVPHGKRVDERSVRMNLRRTGLGNLARLLEKVAQAGHPIVVSKLNIRKRMSEPDSFDVDVVFSAYDRKDTVKGALTSTVAKAATAATTDTGDAVEAQEAEPREAGGGEEEQP